MISRISIEPGGHIFECASGQSILDAAIANNIPVSYGCRSGFCGSCKARLTGGKIEYRNSLPVVLTESEMDLGFILLCQAYPVSDLKVALPDNLVTTPCEIKSLPVRVLSLEKLSSNVMRLLIRLPIAESFHCEAGQWVYFILENQQKKAFSVANLINQNHQLEFHIRYLTNGLFSESVFTELKPGDLLRIEGPFGGFTLRESAKPVLFVAVETGFSPIKALLESLVKTERDVSVHLFCGAARKQDLYQRKLIDDLLTDRRLKIDEVLGDMAQFVLNVYPDLSAYDVYIAGAPGLISEMCKTFINASLDPAALYSEPFYHAGPA